MSEAFPRPRTPYTHAADALRGGVALPAPCLRPTPALAAADLFRRLPRAMYQALPSKPCRTPQATWMAPIPLARRVDGPHALVVGQPATLRHRPRQAFCRRRLWKSRRDLPPALRALIRRLAGDHSAWVGAPRPCPTAQPCPRHIAPDHEDTSAPTPGSHLAPTDTGPTWTNLDPQPGPGDRRR